MTSQRVRAAVGPTTEGDMPEEEQIERVAHRRRAWLARLAPLLSASLLCAACTVGPDFKRPVVPVAPEWRASDDPRIARQAATDSSWWKAFGDPTLDRLVETAYAENLSLQVAGLRIVEARARLALVSGKQFPQLQIAYGSASAQGITQYQASGLNLERNFLDFQLGFDAVWELDFWGKYRRGVQAEAASLLATVADYYSAVVALTAEVARTYATLRTYEVLVEQGRANVRLQEDGLHIAESRFRNGATSELDVTQATTLLESTRASIPELEVGAQQASNALCTLLGKPVGSFDSWLTGPKEIPKAPLRVAVSVPAEMLRRRPDIRRAELQAAAQCARIGVAKAELYPSLSLIGTIGLQANTSSSGSMNLFSGDSLVYSVGPRIAWPFFNYGRLKNNVRIEDARLEQLLVGYRSAVLQAAQEVEDALVGFLSAQQTQEFAQNSVTAALRSQELAMIQYREGAVDYQRVLDAQRSLLREQNTLARARSSIATQLIALYKALGGGWELRQGQPFVREQTEREMKERTSWGDLLSEPPEPEREQSTPPAKQ
jgi:NodT family efflux transporter outer membrane factor (OMF) lipoprotein